MRKLQRAPPLVIPEHLLRLLQDHEPQKDAAVQHLAAIPDPTPTHGLRGVLKMNISTKIVLQVQIQIIGPIHPQGDLTMICTFLLSSATDLMNSDLIRIMTGEMHHLHLLLTGVMTELLPVHLRQAGLIRLPAAAHPVVLTHPHQEEVVAVRVAAAGAHPAVAVVADANNS